MNAAIARDKRAHDLTRAQAWDNPEDHEPTVDEFLARLAPYNAKLADDPRIAE